MGLWKKLMMALGLSKDARVYVSAPGMEVVITGEPRQVHGLVQVVKRELEREARRREVSRSRLRAGGPRDVVEPSELDEMDSPYALPEGVLRGSAEDTTDEGSRPSSDTQPGHGVDDSGSATPRADLTGVDPPTRLDPAAFDEISSTMAVVEAAVVSPTVKPGPSRRPSGGKQPDEDASGG